MAIQLKRLFGVLFPSKNQLLWAGFLISQLALASAAEECEQIKCLSGLTMLDSSVEITGAVLVDKGIYIVERSTPTADDTRAIIWLEASDDDLKIIFPNGTVRVLAVN